MQRPSSCPVESGPGGVKSRTFKRPGAGGTLAKGGRWGGEDIADLLADGVSAKGHPD